MSELYVDPSPCNSDNEYESPSNNKKILNITMFATQPFSSRIDMSKPVYVYFGNTYSSLRTIETSSNITWISAEQHDAFKDCITRSQNFVCIVDPSIPTFSSLVNH